MEFLSFHCKKSKFSKNLNTIKSTLRNKILKSWIANIKILNNLKKNLMHQCMKLFKSFIVFTLNWYVKIFINRVIET